MKIEQCRISFIGFGHMARIICEAIQKAAIIPSSQMQFVQKDPDKMKRNEEIYQIAASSLEHAVTSSDVLLLCVRPSQLSSVLPDIAKFWQPNKILVSILAGVSIHIFQEALGQKAHIIRIMPNVASAVGEGMTLLSFSSHLPEKIRSFIHLFVSPLGRFIEIGEAHMNIATAIAGSGPGFVFKLIQAMADVGMREGLLQEEALLLAAQTFLGASRLVLEKKDLPSLIEQIATPNGVTESGLKAMEQMHIALHFQKVIETAKEKAEKLS